MGGIRRVDWAGHGAAHHAAHSYSAGSIADSREEGRRGRGGVRGREEETKTKRGKETKTKRQRGEGGDQNTNNNNKSD